MKQAIFTEDGMKQIIDTGYKLFDEQTNCLSTANCIANTMMGFYVRPYNQTSYDQRQFPEGVLMNQDLEGFDLQNCPDTILKMITSPERTVSVKFYQFFVYPNNHSSRKVFGYGLCTEDDAFLAYGLSKHEALNQHRYQIQVKKHLATVIAMQYVSDLGDPTPIAWIGCWEGLSEQGKEKYDQWVKPLVK